jgi:hypothetical protein
MADPDVVSLVLYGNRMNQKEIKVKFSLSRP